MARPSGRDIRQEVLTEATRAIQSAGVAGFSYGDLAREVGVRAPSIHHHFRHKDDLVAETTRRYRHAFRERVAEIGRDGAVTRLTAYCELFLGPTADGHLCLCGAVAASWDDAGPRARDEVDAFFADELAWLTSEVAAGVAAGELRSEIEPASFAASLLAALEGALLLARTPAGASASATPLTLLALARS